MTDRDDVGLQLTCSEHNPLFWPLLYSAGIAEKQPDGGLVLCSPKSIPKLQLKVELCAEGQATAPSATYTFRSLTGLDLDHMGTRLGLVVSTHWYTTSPQEGRRAAWIERV